MNFNKFHFAFVLLAVTVVVLLVFFSTSSSSSNCYRALSSSSNYYRAAVLELAQFSDLSYSPVQIVQQNLKIYETSAKAAALNGADIIVFPECGLFPTAEINEIVVPQISDDIPNPHLKLVNPCKEKDFKNHSVLSQLSCLAEENGIFVVANMFDRKNCTSNTQECADGHFYYNTNVIFDRGGALVARYYKRHPYFEKGLKTTDSPESIYFETDFGNFTSVICFDLLFKDSVDAVSKSGVSNLAFSAHWDNHIPLLMFATPIQQAFAFTNRINLLAANVHDPRTGTLGSGIYSADRGALIYTDIPDGRSKLLISNVPKIIDDTTRDITLNTKRFIVEGDIITEEETEEENSWTDCSTKVLGKASNNLTDYRCFSFPGKNFEYVKLEGKEGNMEVCSNKFCCSLSYQANSMDEEYFLGYTGKPLSIYYIQRLGSEICFLARCETVNGVACANFKLQSHTIFQRVQIRANFSTQYVYPFAMNSGVRLTNLDDWSFSGNNEISYQNLNKNSSLLFLGLTGRIYEQDRRFL